MIRGEGRFWIWFSGTARMPVRIGGGLTAYHTEEAVVIRIMMEHPKETVIAVDRQKLGYESFSFMPDLSSVSWLITGAPEGSEGPLKELKKSGLNISWLLSVLYCS